MMNFNNSFKFFLLAIAIFSNNAFANAGVLNNATEIASILASTEATLAPIRHNVGMTPSYDNMGTSRNFNDFNHEFNDFNRDFDHRFR